MSFFMHVGIIGLEAFVTIRAVDFVTGLVHWAEDTFVREETPVVGKLLGVPNALHHRDPRSVVSHSWLRASWDLASVGLLLVTTAWLLGLLTWGVCLFAVLGANANYVHKCAHRTRAENGRVLSMLQDVGIMQSALHHAAHHGSGTDGRYCVLTNLLNPLLDRTKFWLALEWLPTGEQSKNARPLA